MKRATAAALESSAAVLNAKGEWVIPGTIRPDGTFRKDRIVKEGYVPQEEVKAFVPRGAINSGKPVGIPGLSVKAAAVQAPPPPRRQPKKAASAPAAAEETVSTNTGSTAVEGIAVTAEKQLRNLRKKVREIDDLAQRIADNASVPPTSDQMGKLSKKMEILKEIAILEATISSQNSSSSSNVTGQIESIPLLVGGVAALALHPTHSTHNEDNSETAEKIRALSKKLRQFEQQKVAPGGFQPSAEQIERVGKKRDTEEELRPFSAK